MTGVLPAAGRTTDDILVHAHRQTGFIAMPPSLVDPATTTDTPLCNRGYGPTLPFGWYCLDRAESLAVGDVRRFQGFGQEWVMFRDFDGMPGILDAYCPHLGAHLAIGGRVDGKLLRCPFHAWGFDAEGYCRDIPYTDKPGALIGKRRLVRALPVIDDGTLLWAWYHPHDDPPRWPLATADQARDKVWSGYEGTTFDVACSAQDILENSVDYTHLKYVHGHDAVLPGNTRYQGIHRQARIEADIYFTDPDGLARPAHYRIDISQTGPGQMHVIYTRQVQLRMQFLVTPITTSRTILRMLFSHPDYVTGSYEARALADLKQEKIGQHGSLSGVLADLPIWNHKIYRPRPLLCDEDRSIARFRQWFAQFYSSNTR